MNFSSFTFILTDDCNFRCRYCYQQKEKSSLTEFLLESAIDFFFPFFAPGCAINFYGGEPLLEFPLMKKTVQLLEAKNGQKKKLAFSFTTNGSLLNDEILSFLNHHGFLIQISFDGLAQDLNRQENSFALISEKLPKVFSYPNIEVHTHSVFTPNSVEYLASSIIWLIKKGCQKASFALNLKEPWYGNYIANLERELVKLRGFISQFFSRFGFNPIPTLNQDSDRHSGCFRCAAGDDRMALAPDGKIWGCYLFHDYFKISQEPTEYDKYCFGSIDEFSGNYQTVYKDKMQYYSLLRQDLFWRPGQFCQLCDELFHCRICPVYTAYAGSIIGRIPPYFCQINVIMQKESELLSHRLKGI